MRLARLLNDNPNFEARLSRNSPTEQLGTSNATSLQTRARMANEWGADFFISLHCNASTIETASGSEAYVYSRESPANSMAFRILEGLHNRTGLPNRGVFVPAVLVELGFITNPYDRSLLVEDPQGFARGVYNGILSFYGLQ